MGSRPPAGDLAHSGPDATRPDSGDAAAVFLLAQRSGRLMLAGRSRSYCLYVTVATETLMSRDTKKFQKKRRRGGCACVGFVKAPGDSPREAARQIMPDLSLAVNLSHLQQPRH